MSDADQDAAFLGRWCGEDLPPPWTTPTGWRGAAYGAAFGIAFVIVMGPITVMVAAFLWAAWAGEPSARVMVAAVAITSALSLGTIVWMSVRRRRRLRRLAREFRLDAKGATRCRN